MRASSDETHTEAKEEIQKILGDKSFADITVEYSYKDRVIPAVVNDGELVRHQRHEARGSDCIAL